MTRPLAEGGAAVAWLAHRVGETRELVFKAYRAPAAAAAVAEARRLRSVRHPSVVEVVDVGVVERIEPAPRLEGVPAGSGGVGEPAAAGAARSTDLESRREVPAVGTPFVVTALVPGSDLDAYLAGTPEAGRDAAAAELLAQGLAALAHLHRRGVVHRDLHPGNLRVGEADGAPRLTLLDFDLSVPVGRAAPAGGRLGFVAPEQLLGRPEPRSDLWALAASVRWALVRQDPLTGGSELPVEVATWAPRLLGTDPRPLARVRPGVPEALARTIDRCLARDPTRRPTSAREALSWLDPERAAREAPPDPWAFDPPFVGRADELARLAAWLDGAGAAGRSLVACVVGPEASGRRRLVAEALVRAAERALLAGGRPPRIAQRVVEDVEAGLAALRELLGGPEAPDVAALDAVALGREASAFVEQVARVVRAAVELGPGGAIPTRVVLALPARTEPVPGTERLELGPLAAGELAELLGRVLLEPPSPPVVRALAAAGGGWPGLVLAEAAARFPDGRPALGGPARPAAGPGDLAALGAAERRVLARLAVEELPVPDDRLGDDGASPSDDDVPAALPRLQRLGWLRRSAGGWSVAPGRAAALRGLESEAERRRRRLRLAEAPADDGPARLRRAWHRVATTAVARLGKVAAAEAEACRTSEASADVTVWGWALDRAPRALDDATLLALGRTAVGRGRYDLAAAAVREARRRGVARRPETRAAWVGLEATLLRRTGDVRGAEELLRRAGRGEGRAAALLELA
ncbi:MAG: phosphotransferase, partial [Deltaproteobacteria bacterium]|nr:phosphotransferase [Deltaproteobacteria bacterium]